MTENMEELLKDVPEMRAGETTLAPLTLLILMQNVFRVSHRSGENWPFECSDKTVSYVNNGNNLSVRKLRGKAVSIKL